MSRTAVVHKDDRDAPDGGPQGHQERDGVPVRLRVVAPAEAGDGLVAGLRFDAQAGLPAEARVQWFGP